LAWINVPGTAGLGVQALQPQIKARQVEQATCLRATVWYMYNAVSSPAPSRSLNDELFWLYELVRQTQRVCTVAL